MISIQFETDNAAFQDCRGEEIARILKEAAEKIEDGSTDFPIYDINGNKIGKCEKETISEAV